jgi:hypothetical protein
VVGWIRGMEKNIKKFPSSEELIEEAKKENPKADINKLHAITFNLMKKYRDIYYDDKVNNFLLRSSLRNLPKELKVKIKQELLRPIGREDKLYSNFMEEAFRRISQTFQTISGNLAELCVEKDLIDAGLRKDVNYQKKKEHTDLIIYYPNFPKYIKKHRIEVKNVKLRERGTRGLAFDGDSMVGFFNDPAEFTASNIEIINNQCKKTGGYCYVPPATLKKIADKIRNGRFKTNEELVFDIKKFIKTGII